MTDAQIKVFIAQGVADALVEIEANKTNRNGNDHDLETGSKRTERVARECTYSDLLKCQPLHFKGTEGVVSLTQWFEKMEFVFHINNYTVACQIKFATCTLLGSALTWWNSHVKTVGHDAAYGMPWKTLKKMMIAKYCPRGEIKKLEIELWNLKVKGTDVLSYNQRFQELALMCSRMFPKESDEVEKYVGGFPDMIQGSVMASKPKTMQDAIEFATELMDQKICSLADRQAENKRKLDDTSKNNQNQQQPLKGIMWQGPILLGLVRRKCTKDLNLCALNATTITKGSVHQGATNARKLAIWPVIVGVLLLTLTLSGVSFALNVGKGLCYGHDKDKPELQCRYGPFFLNNYYASILFDTGADRSFVSTAFSSLIDIVPTTLDHGYDVELADGKIIKVNTLIRGCTLNFLNHPFNIDLMLVDLGSFDVIIGVDCNNRRESWLNIISCTKTQKYLLKGCHVFLAHITAKKAEDKSTEKRLEDVPIVRDFPEVFPEDLSGIPPTRQVQFQIDLVPCAAPVARTPYWLAPSEMKELSDQLQELSDKGFIRPSSSP
ncbi:putative reverse transcriptase domain-containing protein [Tanacetum coccineum]